MANLINANSNQNYFQFHESHYKYEKGEPSGMPISRSIFKKFLQNSEGTIFPGPLDALFFPEKCDLNSTCVLCAEGLYYFQTYKYPYIFYMKKVTHRVKTTMKTILVAVTTIFRVSVMNKLHYGC